MVIFSLRKEENCSSVQVKFMWRSLWKSSCREISL